MNTQQQQNGKPFGENYWKEDGGRTWVEQIDQLEAGLAPLSRLLLARSGPARSEIVLDVGCGGGQTSMEMAELVGDSGRITGIDISPPIVDVARARAGESGFQNLQFDIDDAGSADLGEDVFDLIFSRFGVMFFEQPIAAFTNLNKALKPTGRFVFMCWRGFEENPWMSEPAAAVFEILPPAEAPQEPDPDAPGPFSLGQLERIDYLLKAAGFSTIVAEAVDVDMPLGSLEDALATMTRIGPAAKAIADADEPGKAAAMEVLLRLLKKYETPEGVAIPGASWIVTAGK